MEHLKLISCFEHYSIIEGLNRTNSYIVNSQGTQKDISFRSIYHSLFCFNLIDFAYMNPV